MYELMTEMSLGRQEVVVPPGGDAWPWVHEYVLRRYGLAQPLLPPEWSGWAAAAAVAPGGGSLRAQEVIDTVMQTLRPEDKSAVLALAAWQNLLRTQYSGEAASPAHPQHAS